MVASLNVVVDPVHTLSVPSIAVGNGFTVNIAVAIQPVPVVYVIVAVLVVATTPPVTMPVVDPTLAIPVALLLQIPPPAASVKVVVNPEQTASVPSIAVGNGFTVTTAVMMQPVGNVYVIVAVLVVNTTPPVTRPVAEPILAIPEALLLHVPPVVASLNVVVSPEQTLRVPSIAVGDGFTVTTAVTIQLVPIV